MLTKEDLDMKHLKWVLILGTLAVVLIAGSFFVGDLIAGAAAATANPNSFINALPSVYSRF